jgi:DNA-binding response OmpR family regulator
MKILVADDDRVMSLMMCGLLKEAGHKTFPVFDAMQALMFAMREQLDLVLLDINMPGGTGVEALRKLKLSSKTKKIPVIVVTGNTDPAVEKEVMEIGAAAYVTKPIEPEALLATVKDVLG